MKADALQKREKRSEVALNEQHPIWLLQFCTHNEETLLHCVYYPQCRSVLSHFSF